MAGAGQPRPGMACTKGAGAAQGIWPWVCGQRRAGPSLYKGRENLLSGCFKQGDPSSSYLGLTPASVGSSEAEVLTHIRQQVAEPGQSRCVMPQVL